jgi:hypothetical protein
VSEHNVQSVPFNAHLPPGSPDASAKSEHTAEGTNEDYAVKIGDEEPKEGAEYPESKVMDEETHKAQEEAAAEARVKRAQSVSSPRRLSEREKQTVNILLGLTIVKDADSVTDVVIPMEDVPEEIRASFNEVGTERNIFQRNIATPVYGGEPKALIGLKLTEIGLHLYSVKTAKGDPKVKGQKATKLDGESKTVGRRSTKYHDGLKLKKIAENPRPEGTMGYYSWQLYRDGMTYHEYMSIKDFGEHYSLRTGEKFRGPGLNHWTWDLEHGFTGLYKEGEPETLEDGSPNPNYWSVNNNPK